MLSYGSLNFIPPKGMFDEKPFVGRNALGNKSMQNREAIDILLDAYPERFGMYAKATLSMEGGWTNQKSDPGGATMFGLSSRANPDLAVKIRTKTLSLSEALEVYYNKYYVPLVDIDKVDGSIGFLVFDSNFHGMREVIMLIQQACNEIVPSKLVVDGIWGRQTASVVTLLSKTEINYVMRRVKTNVSIIAKSASARVMKYQENNNLASYDYTRGFRHRMVKRLIFAEQAAYV